MKVDTADAAVAAQQLAEQKNRDFRTIGERKALIDSFKALRKATYGKLSEMPHAHPEEHPCLKIPPANPASAVTTIEAFAGSGLSPAQAGAP